MTTLVWFRQDLRPTDNPALTAALIEGHIIPIYIQASSPDTAPKGGAERWWRHHSLTARAKDIAALGSRLVIRHGDPLVELRQLIAETGATHVVWHRRREPGAMPQDQTIKAALKAEGILVRSFNGNYLNEFIPLPTVGYGDIIPITSEARLFSIRLVILGLLVFATSLTAILGPMMNKQLLNLIQPRRKPMQRKDHIIVAGNGSLARNAAKSLEARGLSVTVIWPTKPPECADPPSDLILAMAATARFCCKRKSIPPAPYRR
ncbi:MAG: deoxyribodipyrimidine photo-lyase [Halothiobacillus sp.]